MNIRCRRNIIVRMRKINYKRAILGVGLLVIIAIQALMVLDVYVSLKYQIDDPVNEVADGVINNVHSMIGSLSAVILFDWVVICLLFLVIMVVGRKKAEATAK